MANQQEDAAHPADAVADDTMPASDAADPADHASDPADDPVPTPDPAPTGDPAPTDLPSEPGTDAEPVAPTDPVPPGATPAAPADPHPPAKTGRRILPARSSTPKLAASPAKSRTWSHLRVLTLAALAAWALVAVGLIGDELLDASRAFAAGLFLLAAVVAAALPVAAGIRQVRQFGVPPVALPLLAAILFLAGGHWREAAVLMAGYATLLALHQFIISRSEQPIHDLAAARPTQALLAGAVTPLPIKEITVGDTVVVGKDEIVPVDGFVEAGVTTVDQSIVTGSPAPVDKHRGSDIYAGSRNLGADIQVRVGRRPSQRTIVRVARAARTALPHPSRAQTMLDDLAGAYTIAMVAIAAVAFLVLRFIGDNGWTSALERTAAFLVAASPAALILVAPAAYRAAMANAIRHGVLFRGQDELETLGTVQTIAFDKTGTLTAGKPAVTGVVECNTGWTSDEILQRAAAAELRSDHRLGIAIVESARSAELTIPEPFEFTPSPGKGIIATVDGRTVAVGNANLFAELGVNIWRATEISADMRDEGRSAVLVGDRDNVRGVIGVVDPLRPEAPEVVADLGQLGIRRTAMLTGDDEVVANVIAREAGLREVYADLLPEEKLGVIRQMEQSAPVGVIAGAGENSPTLALATSGIVLGSAASDVTREPAGVLLFGGELASLPFALWLARTARRTTNVALGLIVAVMAVLATGALVVGIPALVVILGWFAVPVLCLLAAIRLFGLTRRPPRRPAPVEAVADRETPAETQPLPRPRYVIDDDDDDDEDDL